MASEWRVYDAWPEVRVTATWVVAIGDRVIASNLTEREARMIAAAPALLEACKQYESDECACSGVTPDASPCEPCYTRAAIAKAEPERA